MIKPRDPRELAIDLLPRSICQVQVAAVVTAADGSIISWGWNSVGSGMGQHAEDHAIRRTNRSRLWYGTIYVAGNYKRGTLVNAKPCDTCRALINKYFLDTVYRDKSGKWRKIDSLVQ